jgi:hypothetical protein
MLRDELAAATPMGKEVAIKRREGRVKDVKLLCCSTAAMCQCTGHLRVGSHRR